MPEVDGFKVDFDEAIEHFKAKVRLPTDAWTDLWQGQHARAFVVAGARRDDMLADFQRAVRAGLEEGTTLADFRKSFDEIVDRHGWSYKGGREWRSRVIFETNLRTSYAAGRWQQIQRVAEDRPWLRYMAVRDAKTRPEHLAWHGTVLRHDHPWWDTYYPPNDWGCRCIVQQLSDDDLESFGYEPSRDAPPSPLITRTVNTPDGPVDILVPEGVGPGWAYNVGKAGAGRGADLLAQERHGSWGPLTAPGGNRPRDPAPMPSAVARARLGPRVTGEEALRSTLRQAIGGDEATWVDPLGGRVTVNQSLVDHMLARSARLDGREAYWPLTRELIEEPAEIWAGFETHAATGRVRLRRRYVKLFALHGDRTLGLVADLDGGRWAGLTFFRGFDRSASRLRQGLRIYREGGG